MKKFRFTLQAVYQFKKTQEKQKKAELSGLSAEISRLTKEKTGFERKLEEDSEEYRRTVSAGMPASQMAWYGNFAQYIQDMLRKVNAVLAEAQRKRELLQSELVAVLKEMETLEKLREEQYRAFLEEAAKEEEKELGDLMSYRKTAEAANASGQDA
ncbi:flagellar export protein FliJ [Papillibacter cinnamivorans]|uniref:Flagellar FliJ protein n=1 Tax=Papillibacter cinnamivorans DSM 12816 TaxID=1122930 RepID=A0A1W1YHN6_9FIRM|nr:flagellar export protein FliJ [Papillibacter cinnamivorans]SMC35653.1 FliJ protein [Papillibacter cinnamivorans DSM 12816]